MTPSPSDRAVAFSVQLAQAHRELRRRISRLQATLGRSESDTDTEAVVTHCLAFCTALTTHHRGEDAGMFTDLLTERPDLADLIGKLVQDHEMMGTILERVADLAGRARGAGARELTLLGGELDGLAAIMESHFRFEERAVGAALDRNVSDTGWSVPVFRLQ